MKINKMVLVVCGCVWLITACQNESNKVSFNTLEASRQMASDNAIFNAAMFRNQNPQYTEYSISTTIDSSQMVDCPQGDGWATVKLLNQSSMKTEIIKCSTVSAAIGCLIDSDFKTKTFSAEDGKCNIDIPFPLQKIGK